MNREHKAQRKSNIQNNNIEIQVTSTMQIYSLPMHELRVFFEQKFFPSQS